MVVMTPTLDSALKGDRTAAPACNR